MEVGALQTSVNFYSGWWLVGIEAHVQQTNPQNINYERFAKILTGSW